MKKEKFTPEETLEDEIRISPNGLKDLKVPEELIKEIEGHIHIDPYVLGNMADWYNMINWYNMFNSLKSIFEDYYIIKDNDEFNPIDSHTYEGGFVYLNNKYKEKYIKDVYEIVLKSPYPRRIDELFISGKKCSDKYLPYIFHVVLNHVDSSINGRKFFINYTFGILSSGRLKVDFDVRKEVAGYYNDIWKSIDKRKYYYVDTDSIFLKEDNVDYVMSELEKHGLQCLSYKVGDMVFSNKKRYLTINGRDVKLRGLKHV